MSSMNGGDSLQELLADTLDPLKEALARLEDERVDRNRTHRDAIRKLDTEHTQAIRQIEDDIDRLRTTLKGLGLKEKDLPKPRGRQTSNGDGGGASGDGPIITAGGRVRKSPGGVATGYGVSVEAALSLSETITEMIAAKEKADEEPVFTQKEVRAIIGSSNSNSLRAGLDYLRSVEFLRRAGFDSRGELYAILDADAMQKEVEKLNNTDAALRKRFLNASKDSDDGYERAAAILREEGTVTGVVELTKLADLTDSRVDSILTRFDELNLIRRERKRGTRTIIHWEPEEAVHAE